MNEDFLEKKPKDLNILDWDTFKKKITFVEEEMFGKKTNIKKVIEKRGET